MTAVSWIEVAARCALGLLAYAATGILASAAIVRLDEWNSRANHRLSPGSCRKLSRELRGPAVLLWPLMVLIFVAIYCLPWLSRAGGLLGACERLSLWAFPDRDDRGGPVP